MKRNVKYFFTIVIVFAVSFTLYSDFYYAEANEMDESVIGKEDIHQVGSESSFTFSIDKIEYLHNDVDSLRVFVVYEGEIKERESYNFDDLERNHDFSYVPFQIGEHLFLVEVIVDGEVVDRFSETVMVVSDFGPFELKVKPVGNRLDQNQKVPVKNKIQHHGNEPAEVLLRTIVDCVYERNTKTETAKMEANDTKIIWSFLPSCDQKGLYDIRSEIVFNDRIMVESSTEIEFDDMEEVIDIIMPETVDIDVGDYEIVPIEIINQGDELINDVHITFSELPNDYYSTNPVEISEIQPNDSKIFLVNLTVPDRFEGDYRFSSSVFIASSNNLAVNSFNLNVERTRDEFKEEESNYYWSMLVNIYEYIIFIVLVISGISLVFKTKERERKNVRNEKLSKLQDEIGV